MEFQGAIDISKGTNFNPDTSVEANLIIMVPL
jgi:hypothetical protein